MLIVGLGDIGREFGWRMKALGCTVTGVKRTPGGCPDYVDRLVLMDQIEEELPNADIVALCLPSTPETRHFFDQRRLALTRRDCVLVNVGRGVTVETPALCALLDQGHFGGLVLDVVDPEPPVSYTHLDVYKRQEMGVKLFFQLLCRHAVAVLKQRVEQPQLRHRCILRQRLQFIQL